MLTVGMPMLLALLGTALMAVVIFAPSRIPAAATVSFAPPLMPPAVEHWERSSSEPAWPLSIDARAVACDASARIELVRALGTLRSPWAESILRRALAEEADPGVRAAAAAALSAG